MRQRSLAASTISRNGMFCCRVESKYLVGSSSPSGHSISSHSFAGFTGPWWRDATCTRRRANREDRRLFVPSRQAIVRHAFAGSARGDVLDRDRIGGIAATPLRCPATPRARCPHQALRLNAGDIDLPQLGDARAQLGVVAEAGINQHQIARKAHLTRPANLIERDLRFGLEADVFRHSRLTPTAFVLSPV